MEISNIYGRIADCQTMSPEGQPKAHHRIRQRLTNGFSETKNLVIRKTIVDPGAWILGTPATRWAEIVAGEQPFEFAPGFADKFIGAISDGCIPIVIANHQSDQEMLELAYPMNEILLVANEHLPEDKKLKGYQMITANSLNTGMQRLGERMIFGALQKRFLKRHHIEPIFITTKNDNHDRGIRKNIVEFLKKFKPLIATGNYGVFIFPEASIKAGKLNKKTGKRNGMQQFKQGSISSYIEMIKKETGRETVIIPMSVSGAWNIYDHTNSRPTGNTVKAGLIGRGADIPKVVHTLVSLPIRSDEEPIDLMLANEKLLGIKDPQKSKESTHKPLNLFFPRRF